MRTLVTGGAGFIGSHLVDRLLADGAEVTVLDDLSTGSAENLRRHEGDARFRTEIGCVTDRRAVHRLTRGRDVVFHLAAAVGVRLAVTEPRRAIRVHVEGTDAVLAAAAEAGAVALLASSSEVYGTDPTVPCREDQELRPGPADRLRGGYACSKALAEWMARAWAVERGVPSVVVRLFNTVGPRQRGRYGMVLPRFVDAALRGEPLVIYGDGRQTRCFAHVADTVEAMLRLAVAPTARGATVNVGSDREVSIRALAELVIATTGRCAPIRHVTFRSVYSGEVDVRRRVPALDRIVELTGFRPSTPLERIVADVVEDRSRNDAPVLP